MTNVVALPSRLSIAVAAHRLFLASQALGKYIESNRDRLIEIARASAPDHTQYAFPALRVNAATNYPINAEHEADHLGLDMLRRFMEGMVVNNLIDIGRVGYMEALGDNCFIYKIINNPAKKIVCDKSVADPENSSCSIGFVINGWNVRIEVKHDFAEMVVRLDVQQDFKLT